MGQQTLAGRISMTPESQPQPETAQANMASDNKRGRSESVPVEIAGDSDVDEVQEQPPSKKRRTSQRGAEGPADGLDGGEIADESSTVNSLEASSPAQSPPREHLGWNEGVKPAGLRISFGSAVASAGRKQATVPTSREPETSAEETVAAEEPVTAEPPLSKSAAKKRRRQGRKAAAAAAAAASATATGEQQPAPPEEAQLQQNGRQTRAQALRAAEAAAAATEQPAPATVNGDRKKQPRERNRRYKYFGQTWQLPPGPGPEWGPDESRTWQFKFEQWLQDYVAVNNNKDTKLEILRDPTRVSLLLQNAYFRWQKGDELEKWREKAAVPLVQYRNQDKFPLLISTIEQNLAQGKSMSPMPLLMGAGAGENAEAAPVSGAAVMESDAGSPDDEAVRGDSATSKSPGEISEHTGDDPEGEVEVDDADEEAYRERYYPGITDDRVFCTSCAGFGHRRHSCPEANCRFCGDSEHMAPGCPTRQRCPKCKQLGHTITHCREKLALAPGEDMECAFCASREHTESDCTEFFRTYRCSQESLHKVKYIPIFCYCCGNEGHYGTQCGLNPAPTKTASIEIWSKDYWQQFVDPNSAEEAIAWDLAATRNAYAHDANGRPDFGKSIVPRTHIIFEDDDDDEEEGFIRPPVQRKEQRNGQIINVSRQGRGGFSSLAQQAHAHNPPLPPGPPPGLPARPPQPNEDAKQRRRPRQPNAARNNNRGHGSGQQSGRGGGAGGFRIRGRGRGKNGGGRW